jgi:L-ribulose-5-phosphate 3-epimerase
MNGKKHRIGFMQGRLSPPIDGKIQAFPWPYWENEFSVAAGIGLSSMEWTLDQDRIFDNPLMTLSGQEIIRRHATQSGVAISSLTGDCFMQAPFWKAGDQSRRQLIATFEKVLLACASVKIEIVVVPLVDNGALTSNQEQSALEETLISFVPLLRKHKLKVAFESDYPPPQLSKFIERLPADEFGINFDIGLCS